MPTYDYKCEECGNTFEYFQSMSDDVLSICKQCNGELKRLIGGGLGIIFKGSGFYVTDNKNENGNTSVKKTTPKDNTGNKEPEAIKKTEPKKETVKPTP
jgi:putative FmdB family regulatory protein